MAERRALDLDALAVSDRFRLFNFTRRDDHVTYLWILRAMDRLREVHQVQVGAGDVAGALRELSAAHPEVTVPDSGLRDRLDQLAADGLVHRFDDASRAGNLASYRNRQSVYQFGELGYWAYQAVENVLGARVEDVNLSRLVFSDVLDDLRALAEANRTGQGEDVYRRLSRLDSVMEDMGRRSAQFHVTLGEILRSTEASPEVFLRHKNALLVHMSDFMAELERYLPRLDTAVHEVEDTGLSTLLSRAAEADERLFMDRAERLEDWRRRWLAVRGWFASDGTAPTRAAELGAATRSAVSGVIALLRQITEAQRSGVNRSTQLRHLAEWVHGAPDDGAAHALMGAAFNMRSARHLGTAHEDGEQISPNTTWWDAPGVEVSVTLFRSDRAPSTGVPKPVRRNPGAKAALRERQAEDRAAERRAARDLVSDGAHARVLDETDTRILLRLVTKALESRSVVAGRLRSADGTDGGTTVRLVPSEEGSTVRTVQGSIHLPGFRLELLAGKGK
ncbi:TIGR02677 family protein [Nocardiopsis sp. HNM0947]|uniref:TIGR02677 family protein n=1 Tax=Nocardiopsis coralli TaxID=2772213 RepID=A0ABR9PB34_9ACTN|nr:TIGR02677 family protein [Nocardiopsis coralli]MBE3001037.1 TIGR02677 family protein [Nocardiopsis coralli]